MVQFLLCSSYYIRYVLYTYLKPNLNGPLSLGKNLLVVHQTGVKLICDCSISKKGSYIYCDILKVSWT